MREEREIRLHVSLKRVDGIVTGNFHSLKEWRWSSTEDIWPYSRPLKNYPARQFCLEWIGHLPPSTKGFSNLPCNVIWSYSLLIFTFHPRFPCSFLYTSWCIMASAHLFSHWLHFKTLFGIGRSLSSFFYPSPFADLSISLHLIPNFSHILSLHITLLCIFFITSSHVPACTIHRPSLLQIITTPSCHYCCLYCPPAFITHVFLTELTLVGYLKVDEASTSKMQLFHISIIQYTNLYNHGRVRFWWPCIPL